MKVSELFAEIGFKVDTKGLDEFSKAMKGIKETIKSCVSGLREFSKAAEQINRAVQNIRSAYVPTQKEAAQRYRAETYYFRSAGKELRGRGIMEAGKGDYWENRAQLANLDSDRLWRSLFVREENLRLRKEGKSGGGSTSYAVAIGTIIGNIVSRTLHSLLSSLKGIFISLFSFVRDTVRAAMSYRDYQVFTGRSVNELSGLMGLTAYTSGMTPKDILKDAQSMQKNYWDMWFGKASPDAWLRLGIVPTGNGAQDLRSALMTIYNMTDKGQNSGLAMSLLSSLGLDEQYMNIFKAMREGRQAEFQVMQNEISAMDNANTKLNEFAQQVDQARMAIVTMLLEDGGLKEMLDYFLSFLKTMVSLLRGGTFKGKSLGESMDIVGEVLNATPQQREAWSRGGSGPVVKPGVWSLTQETVKGSGVALYTGFKTIENWILQTAELLNGREYDYMNPFNYFKEQMGGYGPSIINNIEFVSRGPEEDAITTERYIREQAQNSLIYERPEGNAAYVLSKF